MQISFTIDDRYLLVHTLASMGPRAFSASAYNATVVNVQTEAWNISPSTYNLLVGRLFPQDIAMIERVALNIQEFSSLLLHI